jgi:hypothetical protein
VTLLLENTSAKFEQLQLQWTMLLTNYLSELQSVKDQLPTLLFWSQQGLLILAALVENQ